MTFGEQPSRAALDQLADSLREYFPDRQPIRQVQMEVAASADGGMHSNTRSAAVGLRLTNAGLTRVLQVRTNGLSFSHLPPYTEWETFREEAKGFVRAYIELLRPKTVSRLAVRYINQIPVPVASDIDRYINLSPRLLPGLPNVVDGYFLQLRMPQVDIGPEWIALLNTAVTPSGQPDTMHLMLDIDQFAEIELPPDEGAIWDLFEILRRRKNKIFEAAITDETRELIK